MGKLNTKITVDGKMYEVTSHVAAEIKELLTPFPSALVEAPKKVGAPPAPFPPVRKKQEPTKSKKR